MAVVVVATALVAGGTTTVRIAMLEAAHRVVRPANTVRAFTLIHVVASTSLQVGLLVSGLLITASTRNLAGAQLPLPSLRADHERGDGPGNSVVQEAIVRR